MMNDYSIGLVAGVAIGALIIMVFKLRNRGSLETSAEKAEYLTRQRARMLPVLAILLITQQGAFLSSTDDGRTVDHVKIAAWVVMAAIVLLALMTGGGWAFPKQVRDLANDESTQLHRLRAMRLGFINAMLTCFLLYVLGMFTPVPGRDAVHIVTTVGLASALISFAALERRALRNA
jgi:predicted permease